MFEDGGFGGMGFGGMPGMGGGQMQNGMKELMLKQQQQQMMQQRQRFAELDKIRANAWKTMGNAHDQFVGSGKMSSQQFWNQPWAQTYMGALRDVTKGMGLPDDVDGHIAGISQRFAQADHLRSAANAHEQAINPSDTNPHQSREEEGEISEDWPGQQIGMPPQNLVPTPQPDPRKQQAGPSGPGNVPVPQFNKQSAVTGGEGLSQEDASAISPPSKYAGTGGFNFMGSQSAQAMGMHVTPASTKDMVTRKTAAGNITVNKYAADDIAGFLNDLHAAGAPLNQFNGVYNPKRLGHGWSQHAYGNAVDIESGFGKGPDNSPGLFHWAQKNPEKFQTILDTHHMKNLASFDWGHFEWSPSHLMDKTQVAHASMRTGAPDVSQIRAMREGKEPQIAMKTGADQPSPQMGGGNPANMQPNAKNTQLPLMAPEMRTMGSGRNAIMMPQGIGQSALSDGVYRGGLSGRSGLLNDGVYRGGLGGQNNLMQLVHSAPRFKNPQMDDPYYGVGGPADKFKSQPGLSGTGQFPPAGAGQAPQAPAPAAAPPAQTVAQSSFVTSGQLPPLPDNQLKVFGSEKNEVFRFMTPDQFDFMAMQYAKGNQGGLPKTGRNKDIALLDQMLIARAADYWKFKGLSADDANSAMLEFQAKKAGSRKIAQMQAQTIVALDKAENSAPVVLERSKDVPRTEYPLLNSILMAAKEQTGDTKVIRFGQAMETLISNYASALANGNSVITDHMRKKAEGILQKAWSEGQVEAGVNQLLVEIDREKKGTMQAMPDYLNQGQKQEPTKDPSQMSDDELKKALGIQ